MTMQDKSVPVLLTIGVSIGAAIGAVLLISILNWPHLILSFETMRWTVGVVGVLAFLLFKERRDNRRHDEIRNEVAALRRLVRYDSITDEAERFLRGDAA